MNDQKAIICDIDGTLALLNGRNPFVPSMEDTVHTPVADLLTVYSRQSPKVSIILVSGREDKYKDLTIAWLQQYSIPFNELYMRKSGDFRKDFVIKKEIYSKFIEPKHSVLFVLDDRNQTVNMWREIGLPCFQVAPGDF